MASLEYDVVVLGARIAGSTLATLLGQAGYRVLLVDRARFPSPTLSTHYFRGGRGVTVLKHLVVLESVLALGCPPLSCQYSYSKGGAEYEIQPAQQPGEVAYCLSVRRVALDHLLAQRAAGVPSVDLWETTRATDLLWEDDRVVGVRMVTPTGEQTVRARCVVGADGRRSFVARAVGATSQEEEGGHRGVYYCYVRDFPGPRGAPDGPEFSRIGDEQAYVFPSEGGITCLALSLNLTDFAWMRQQPERRFRERMTQHLGLAERFAVASWEGRILGCGPETNYVRIPYGPGWALVGDAGLHQDPWSGHGMDNAGIHAAFLAEALQDWLSGAASEQDALGRYHQRRDEDALAGYSMTVIKSRDLRQELAA